ncbi:Di-sulfide bridge nucleocytoplasmic transport domain-containing protein [Whalleya microplaca]|nr:Di-sulfide bridge nucleocytoplasmic transport domain-containing protein [Whalleya microplaca]
MDRRTYESPMDWEYQDRGPLDPSSPFVQSTRQAQEKNAAFGASSFGNLGQNPFPRTQSTPSKPVLGTPSQQPSIFAGSPLKRTTTAPPFRNPAFTTPRKPFDIDVLSEASPAESSPAASDASDFADTPEHDNASGLAHMAITPSSAMNKNRSLFGKKSGKGEIPKTIFASRDKVRKRKRYNADKDISGYRLPYLQQDEYDESDYESDESTFQPSKAPKEPKKQSQDGWFGNFLATIQRHPYAPKILDVWLAFAFNFCMVAGTCWFLWAMVAGLRQDFSAARAEARADIVAEIDKCASDYRQNKCFPVSQRLPAMYELCDQWFDCMNQNPDQVKQISISAKEIVQILNGIIDTMSLKTLAVFAFMIIAFLASGARLFANKAILTGISGPDAPAPPFPSHPAGAQPHMMPPQQQVYWEAINSQTPRTPRHHFITPRHAFRHHGDDTPDTEDGSPPPPGSRFKALSAAPGGSGTPGSRRSPSKGERERGDRGRSPTKRSGSPRKLY